MKPTDISAPDYFHKVVDCQWACPAHTPVPEYIRLIAEGRYSDAYMINWKSNVFPGILGRTCDRPCEPACRRGRVEETPVAICRLKRVAADFKDDVKHRMPRPSAANGRRIAIVGGPAAASTARDRRGGFERRLAELGVPLESEYVRTGSFSHDFGFRAATELLSRPNRPTAVFCSNDLIAFGALDAARTAEIGVPQDLWVVGYDDIMMSSWPAFDLTSMHQPSKEMAETGARALLDRIDDPERLPLQSTFRSHLVVRGSTDHTPQG